MSEKPTLTVNILTAEVSQKRKLAFELLTKIQSVKQTLKSQ
ncbi:hypothetical protein PSMA106859_12460 [Pseudoalteromonas maricaloris]